MESILMPLKAATHSLEMSFRPLFFRLSESNGIQRLNALLEGNPDILIFDTIADQLRELIKIENADRKLTQEQSDALIKQKLSGLAHTEYGVWVFYPWSRRLVHLLDSEEFGKVRTNRNNYKITPQEQQTLYTKKIGIIGLSIGHSIAMTLATERSAGELRLADYDLIELSNLNRIQTSAHNIGLNKVIVAARAVAEIDPFIKVVTYTGGISAANMDDFLTAGSKLDLLVEVCDGLDVKILARHRARAHQIPVIMDTSDNGMIDIERFDQEPERPILHGLLGELDVSGLTNLTTQEKLPYVLKMIDLNGISKRLKASFIEVGQTISSWPQLASAVALGGAVGADSCRKILLGAAIKSGRYYVDIDKIITLDEKQVAVPDIKTPAMQLAAYNFDAFKKQVDQFDFTSIPDRVFLESSQIKMLCDAALRAPSGGNLQPCKWIVRNGIFFLFYDESRSESWLNFDKLGLYVALGAAIENVSVKALELNLEASVHYFPLSQEGTAVAAISFTHSRPASPSLRFRGLAKYIDSRSTNRNQGERQLLPTQVYKEMQQVTRSIPGCEMHIIEQREQLDTLGEILSACDRIRLITQKAHSDFYKEIRWTQEEADRTGDGLEAELLDLSAEDLTGLKVAQDWESMNMIRAWDKGRGLQKMTRKSIKNASAAALITVSSQKVEDLIQAGRSVERSWLHAGSLRLAAHPMISIISLLQRVKTNELGDFSAEVRHELIQKTQSFQELFNLDDSQRCVFLFKLSVADEMHKKSGRLPFDQVFHVEP
jgi:molybdopterin/thiamine biosynthesis adenylyltransferase